MSAPKFEFATEADFISNTRHFEQSNSCSWSILFWYQTQKYTFLWSKTKINRMRMTKNIEYIRDNSSHWIENRNETIKQNQSFETIKLKKRIIKLEVKLCIRKPKPATKLRCLRTSKQSINVIIANNNEVTAPSTAHKLLLIALLCCVFLHLTNIGILNVFIRVPYADSTIFVYIVYVFVCVDVNCAVNLSTIGLARDSLKFKSLFIIFIMKQCFLSYREK